MEPLLFPGLVAMENPENAIECANYFANMKARGVNVVAEISGGIGDCEYPLLYLSRPKPEFEP